MSTTVAAYATSSAAGPFVRMDLERRTVGPHDVSIAIAYAGICHSDIHTAREEWGGTHFPLERGAQ